MNNIRQKVILTIYQITRPEKPDLSDHSLKLLAGTLDSLDYASFLMALEDEFGLSIEEGDIDQLGSIDQIVKFLESKDSF